MFFNMILGASILAIATVVLLFAGWKAYRLLRTDPEALKTLPESEKELSLKDLPPKLIIVLVAALIIALLGDFSVFSFNPFIDTLLLAMLLLLLAYYFLQKRKLQKKP
jgi:Na+/H+ antiporter NhaD/arsenite permease-like protein